MLSKRLLLSSAGVLGISLLLGNGSIRADDRDCPATIEALGDQIGDLADYTRSLSCNIELFGKNCETLGMKLARKLDEERDPLPDTGARTKLLQGKFDEALAYVGEFREGVANLLSRGKIAVSTAMYLDHEASHIAACIQALME